MRNALYVVTVIAAALLVACAPPFTMDSPEVLGFHGSDSGAKPDSDAPDGSPEAEAEDGGRDDGDAGTPPQGDGGGKDAKDDKDAADGDGGVCQPFTGDGHVSVCANNCSTYDSGCYFKVPDYYANEYVGSGGGCTETNPAINFEMRTPDLCRCAGTYTCDCIMALVGCGGTGSPSPTGSTFVSCSADGPGGELVVICQ